MQFGVEASAEAARPEFGHIGGGGGEEAHRVQRGRKRHRAFEREQAEAGLEAADAAEGGGTEHGAQGLRAQREGDHAGRHGGRGARGTSSGSVAGQAWIARRGGIEGGEGRGSRLAEQDGAAAAQAADHVRVELALAAFVERRAVLGGEPASLEDVLDAERNAVEQAIAEGVLRRDFHPGAYVRFADCDAAQTDRQQVERRLLARFQGLEEFEQHYIDQSSLKKPACTIFPGKRASGGTVISTMA